MPYIIVGGGGGLLLAFGCLMADRKKRIEKAEEASKNASPITRRYFRDLSFVIAADDNFNSKGWPVTSVINDRWFRGALVVLVERNRDPAGRPFIGETFLDGLTAEECKVASPYLGFPPGGGPKFPYPPRPAKKRRDRGASSMDQA